MFRKFELHHHGLYMPRLKLAMLIHEQRSILGIRCQSCEYLARTKITEANSGQAQIFGTEWNRIELERASK